jgi:Primase C terminal 1 (PriCT-1)
MRPFSLMPLPVTGILRSLCALVAGITPITDYGGERRHIRPWGPDVPIDVLGNGYAVGAPSIAAKGQYKIIHGTLDDLESLPPLHVMLDEMRKPIPEGKRNQSLFRRSLEQAAHADDFETLMDAMRTQNMDCTVPLSETELEAAARSAWKYEGEGRNLAGRGQAVVMSHAMIDRLDDPDAFYLMALLKRHHWGRDVQALEGYRLGMNARFYTYARRCVEREIWKQATFLRSAVRRKDGGTAKWDLSIDPLLPDVHDFRDYVGSASPSVSDDPKDGTADWVVKASHSRLRPQFEEPRIAFPLLDPVPKDDLTIVERRIISGRMDGLTLTKLADELGVSVATVWRKEKTAIEGCKTHEGNFDCRGAERNASPSGDDGLPS